MTDLPDPSIEPTLDVARAGELLGLGRSAAYCAAHQYLESEGAEGLPVLRFNRRTLRVPTARLLEMLGVSPNGNGNDGGPTPEPALVSDHRNGPDDPRKA